MSRPSRTLMDAAARKALLNGVNSIFFPVRKTFGPQARKALLYRTFNRGSRIVDDGYTIAECQDPKNPFERLVAQCFKEMCKRTNERVGDGTTCTAIIGGKLFNDAYKVLSENDIPSMANNEKIGVSTLKNDILKTADNVKEEIKNVSKKIETLEDLEKIAIVSVENVEIGKIIAKMAWEVGVDGFIDVVEGYKGEIETEVTKGMRFPAKIAAKTFVNNPARYEMVVEDCPVFITNHTLDNVAEVIGAFKSCGKETNKVIVIAPSFSENVLISMVQSRKQGYYLHPVKTPSLRTEQYEDLAIYCGARFIDKAKGMKIVNAKKEDLGFLQKLIVKDTEAKDDAVATGGKGTQEITDETIKIQGKDIPIEKPIPIQERIEILKKQLEETKQEQFKKLLERRIASMASAVGVIRVGDSTEASSLYQKLKIEDAVYACKSALRGGYVKGGGLCLKEIAETLSDSDILKQALLAPYEQIQQSCGGIEIKDEIIDPMEAIYYAVEHATSVVANLITVETITVEDEEIPMGDGLLSIAKQILHSNLLTKRKEGWMKENADEVQNDELKGMSIDEHEYFDGKYL